MWLIGSLGVDRRKLNAWRRLFHGGVFVEPHMPELREFREHFLGELQVINCPFRDSPITVHGRGFLPAFVQKKQRGNALISEIACKFHFYDLRAIEHFSPPTRKGTHPYKTSKLDEPDVVSGVA